MPCREHTKHSHSEGFAGKKLESSGQSVVCSSEMQNQVDFSYGILDVLQQLGPLELL